MVREGMLRLVELLGGLSVALDMGTGSALDESLCRCVVAARVARAAGLSDDEVRDVLYTALLEHLGCTAYAHELADVFGDDVVAVRAGFLTNWTDHGDLLHTFVPEVARATGRSRARVLATALASGPHVDRDGPAATCEVAESAARRLDLSPEVQRGLGHVLTMWNGGGHPATSGDDIPLAARITATASVAALFCLLTGPRSAVEEVHRRTGSYLDPDLSALVTPDLLADLTEIDAYDEVLAAEPGPVRGVERAQVPGVAATFGDLVDLKSPWLHGHSGAVAELAAAAAEAARLSEDDVWTLRVAGHLHDVGRVGVSSRIWDKPGRLTTTERAQVELHPWHTEQVLCRAPALAEAGRIAGQHHERLDGSGYHRRATAGQLPPTSRLLATADRYRSLIEDRPHRQALTPAQAAAVLSVDAHEGRLDADAVAAVLEAAGHPARARRSRPAGLTERQVEVLRLLASGRSNREIAAALVISSRTAEHHVQDIYARIGASTRAGAAVFAMEHGLLGGHG
jgi:HD-GYP domain-containing protein (c-di-GMP phosphodiesterase class II)